MRLAHAACLFVLAEAIREEGREATSRANNSEGHSHGLEIEHDLSLSWALETGDANILQQIVEKVNPAKESMTWEWKDKSGDWTFGAVKMLSGTAKESLALHMLHRHGLAPLISAHSGKFAEHYKQRVAEELQNGEVASCCCKESADCASNYAVQMLSEGKPYCCKARPGKFCDVFAGYSKRLEKLTTSSAVTCPRLPAGLLEINSFISAEESSKEVLELQGLLQSLSLSGLRNLHSYDHQWSVQKGSGKYPQCSSRAPGGCPLQASFSAMTLSFMRSHGFGKDSVESAMTGQKRLFAQMILGMYNPFGSGVSNAFFNNFMQPGHTGRKSGQKLRVENGHIRGPMDWEGGGTSNVDVPITKSEEAALTQLPDNERRARLLEVVEAWMDKQFASHKRWAEANRLKMWAAEEAEFFDLSEQEFSGLCNVCTLNLRFALQRRRQLLYFVFH